MFGKVYFGKTYFGQTYFGPSVNETLVVTILGDTVRFMLVGSTVDLNATAAGSPPITIAWTTDDALVADVDVNTGVVTAIGAGAAVITATATDINGNATDTVNVIVLASSGGITAPATLSGITSIL